MKPSNGFTWMVWVYFAVLICWISFQFNASLDGAAHLYNARVFGSLLNGESWLANFYKINDELIPNYLSTFFLALLQKIFSVSISEKIWVGASLFSFVFSFFLVVKKITDIPEWYLLLVAPLLFNFLLALGFYNFCWSISLFLFSIYSFIKFSDYGKVQYAIMLGLFMHLLYFTHGFNFLLCLSVLLYLGIHNILTARINKSENWRSHFKPLLTLGLVSIPAMILISMFIIERGGGNLKFIPWPEKIDFISEMRPLLAYTGMERTLLKILFYCYWGLFISGITILFFEKCRIADDKKSQSLKWLIVLLFQVLLYFVLPDENSGGGYITIRALFWIFLIMIFFIASTQIPRRLLFIFILAIQVPLYLGLTEKMTIQKDLGRKFSYIENASQYISDHKVLLPIYIGDNWLEGHFSNYLGALKEVLVLNNYEANTNYFPVCWLSEKKKIYTPVLFNYGHLHNGIELSTTEGIDSLDYVFFYGGSSPKNNDSVNFEICKQNFNLLISTDYFSLFKLKNE